jgi:hypothetical protein
MGRVNATDAEIRNLKKDIAELRCHIVGLTESKKEMQRQIDTAIEAIEPAKPEPQYFDFSAAMKAFANGKNVKRRFHQHYVNPTGCPALAISVDAIKANDWMIKDGN